MIDRWVLDASAAVRLVMRAEDAESIANRLEHAQLVIAPELFCAEVGNALSKYVRAGIVGPELAVARYEEASHLVDRFIPGCELGVEALALAMQRGHPVYDAVYAVLARRHAAGVLTRDQRLVQLLSELSIETA